MQAQRRPLHCAFGSIPWARMLQALQGTGMSRYLVALLLMAPCTAITQDHCAYINELERILKTDPELSAEKSALAQPGKFLSVGNGYAPARPGFESTEEMVCVMKSHGFDMIWAGGDVLGCENQREFGQKIEAYAAK